MARYSYEQLETPLTIRLLELCPGEFESEISCQLRHTQLDRTHKYEALSYVWGDRADPKQILLHGRLHKVTKNLESALRHLRNKTQPRFLWIDALCINQDDEGERAQQVAIMGSIYNQATSVLSWLGDASEDSDQAMALIEAFGPRARAYLANELPQNLRNLREMVHWQDFFSLTNFPMDEQNWTALWKLFERPYWYRVWIVQELVQSGMFEDSRGTIICGAASVPKSLLDYTCFTIVLMTGRSNPFGDKQDKLSLTFEAMGHLQAFIMCETTGECAYGPSSGHGLLRLVKATSRLEATRHRDMIYALLPLAPVKYRGLTIDYKAPLKTMLTDFVKYMVETDSNLDVLLGNRFQMERTEPSWTPELSQPEHGWVPQFGHFTAAGQTKPMIEFDDKNDALRVKGFFIGKVDKVIGPEVRPEKGVDPRPAEARKELKPYAKEIRAFAKSLNSPESREAFWRTLVLDHEWQDLKPKRPAPAEFGKMADMILFGGAGLGEKGSRPMEEAQELLQFILPFKKSWELAKWNRCFFTLEEGHCGVGPFCIRENDAVAMLYGGDMLFVLHPDRPGSNPRYTLVGDAYVHGVMQGELLTKGELVCSQTFTMI